ncbi:enoyl-CoA hydratase/isomerase family protein [Neobacillus sp. C211]|uniref:enoyl-CoA hydratase/isomerase family protein n=1 Tax=unclassified Neobacillus TaxID=2675272 RepID=UPI00397890D0
MGELVRFHIEDHVGIVELNDPESRNPLSKELCLTLIDTLKAAEVNESVHVMVLTGAGNSFCAGGNIKEFAGYQEKLASEIHKEGEATTQLFQTLSSLRKPVIGAVNGHALGGGLGLVAACHYSIASTNAKLGTTEIKLGLFPLVILPVLIEAMGSKKALEISFTGEIFKAEKAIEYGLVNKVVPTEQVMESAMEFARKLASASPLALRIGMDCFVKTRDMEWNKKLDYANTLRVISFLSDDLKEGAQAFLEKRLPNWKGR